MERDTYIIQIKIQSIFRFLIHTCTQVLSLSEGGMEQDIGCIIWPYGFKDASKVKVLSMCFLCHVSCRMNPVCVCASYTGLVLMAAELSEDVLGVGGAHADL